MDRRQILYLGILIWYFVMRNDLGLLLFWVIKRFGETKGGIVIWVFLIRLKVYCVVLSGRSFFICCIVLFILPDLRFYPSILGYVKELFALHYR